ncbi:hypothetical protein BJX70DRAFT_396096 [Aspergillus crustosus]
MSPGYLGSGSKVTEKQYVLLRTTEKPQSTREDFLDLRPVLGPDTHWTGADGLLAKALDYQNYLELVDLSIRVKDLARSDAKWPGAFRCVKETQEQTITIDGRSTMQESINVDRPPKRPLLSRFTHDLARRKNRRVTEEGVGGLEASGEAEESSGSSDEVPEYRCNAGALKDSNDETTVQCAFVLLLKEFTSMVPGRNVEWTLDHINLRAGFNKTSFYTARTDGALRVLDTQEPLVIVETKARMREKQMESMIMQETAEIASWILAQPSCSLELEGRRLLFAQDRHQVWITVAQYDESYRRYLLNGTVGPNSNIYMQTYGPWNVLIKDHVHELGLIVVSLILSSRH